jgi:D-glycero-alpha-D-manno-heptose-7-phosphate kinase
LFLHKKISDTDICRLAYDIEVKFNPFCGYQDPYGCGIGGFKRIEFLDTGSVKHEFLSTDVFDGIDIKLVFTGVTRNSKEVLRDVSMNLEKVKPLLPIVSTAYDYLKQGDGKKFLKELNHTWEEKKKTSNIITENEMIRKIDKELSDNSSVISHKLCGAGNGGFFLTFSKHNKLTIPYDTVKIKVNYEGVRGESV